MNAQLSIFKAHCRHMATAEHTPTCEARLDDWLRAVDIHRYWETDPPGPRPECDGCNPPANRALFARLADEVDAYQQGDLFEIQP